MRELQTNCENCTAPLDGGYCSACGQSAVDYNVPVGDFAREMAAETFGLDARLRSTLKALFFKPGAVPLDYVAGRRARFVPPIRLYLFASFAMFLLLSGGKHGFIHSYGFEGRCDRSRVDRGHLGL